MQGRWDLWRYDRGESRRFRVSAFPDLVFPFVVLRLKLFWYWRVTRLDNSSTSDLPASGGGETIGGRRRLAAAWKGFGLWDWRVVLISSTDFMSGERFLPETTFRTMNSMCLVQSYVISTPWSCVLVSLFVSWCQSPSFIPDSLIRLLA